MATDRKIKSSLTIFVVTLCVFVVIGNAAIAAEAKQEKNWSIEGAVRYTYLTPGGEMGGSNGGDVKQTSISDLGMDSGEGAWGFSIGGQYHRPQLFFSGQQSSFSGSGTTSHDISQGSFTIPAGAAVDTTMDLGIYSLAVTYDFLPGKNNLGVGLGIMGLDFEVAYTEIATGVQINIDETYPLPLLAVSYSFFWKRMEFAGLVGGAYIKMNDDEVGYVNLDLSARYAFYKGDMWSWMASLGYRYVDLKMDIKDDANEFKADLNFSGPYIGVRFEY